MVILISGRNYQPAVELQVGKDAGISKKGRMLICHFILLFGEEKEEGCFCNFTLQQFCRFFTGGLISVYHRLMRLTKRYPTSRGLNPDPSHMVSLFFGGKKIELCTWIFTSK